MYLTDLANAARKSGLKVVEVDGWRSRGHGDMTVVRTIVAHHTGTSAQAEGNYPSLRVVRDGTERLRGPLAQLGLGRDGTVYVIAAGLCYHAGVVRDRYYGNAYAIGIEAEHPGVGVWPAGQYAAYARLCAALCDHYDLEPGRVLGHKEVCDPPGRKVDPNFDMAAFRSEITDLMEDDMAFTEDDRARLERLEEAEKKRAKRDVEWERREQQTLARIEDALKRLEARQG